MTYDPLLRDIKLRINQVLTTSGTFYEVKIYSNINGSLLGSIGFDINGDLAWNNLLVSGGSFSSAFVKKIRDLLDKYLST